METLITVEILEVTQKVNAVKTFNAPRLEASAYLRFSFNDPKSLISMQSSTVVLIFLSLVFRSSSPKETLNRGFIVL
jgi:hypothetical protein